MSYFNAASHGLPNPNVYEAMANFLNEQAKPVPGGSLQEDECLLDAKAAVASVLSARVDQLGFTSTTTAAWHAVVGSLDLTGKRVLVTEHEWGDFYRLLEKRKDIEIQILPALDFADPDLSYWTQAIDDDVAAIFVPLVTSIAGYKYPVEEIGSLPRPKGTKLIVDAAQALGQTAVNVQDLNCDAVISTCRKWMRGPRQTALLWINDTWGEDGLPITASDLAPADQNPALLVGLGAAARDILQWSEQQIEQKLLLQADGLRTWASENGIAVFGGRNAKSAIVSLDMDEKTLGAVTDAFDKEGIVGKIVNVQIAEPLQHETAGSKMVLRLSAHVYTSDSELKQLKQVILRSLHQSGHSLTYRES